jgi:hypothetical protein
MTTSRKRASPLGVMLWVRIHSLCQACLALNRDTSRAFCC